MTTSIEHEKNIVFVHVQKCAGQSVCAVLRDLNKDHGHNWEFSQVDEQRSAIMVNNNKHLKTNYNNPRHFRAMDVRDLLGPEKFEQSFKFAISRNPYDRLKSWYHYLRRAKNQDRSALIRNMTLEDFTIYACDHFFLPQWHWLLDEDDKLMVDTLVRMEDLDTEWPSIITQFHDSVIEMPRNNKSANTTVERSIPPFSQVRQATLDKFRKTYAKDFELLGYDDAIPENRDGNSTYRKFQTLWHTETKDLTPPEQLTAEHGVDHDHYMLYRETNSGKTYRQFLQDRIQQRDKQLAKQAEVIEKLKDKFNQGVKTNQFLRAKLTKESEKAGLKEQVKKMITPKSHPNKG